MPKRKIPCSECEEEKQRLQDGGNEVKGCEPVEGEEGWCEIEWEESWD